jgi:hypothetical protein
VLSSTGSGTNWVAATSGSQGTQGTTGTGAQGGSGSQGTQGTTGTGAQGGGGSQGTQGRQGRQGSTGNGNDGSQGTQGRQGATGAGGGGGSDYRIKDNVEEFKDGYEMVKGINSYTFSYKDNIVTNDQFLLPRYNQHIKEEIGFIAHEFQEVAQKIRGSSHFKPVEGVKDQMDANQGTPIYQKIHYEKITPILWGALKETIAKIENLEKKNKVYFNGRSTYKIIDLPDYWVELVDEDSITVQLTPIRRHQKLFVEKIVNNQVYINSDKRGEILNYFYNIYGEKK